MDWSRRGLASRYPRQRQGGAGDPRRRRTSIARSVLFILRTFGLGPRGRRPVRLSPWIDGGRAGWPAIVLLNVLPSRGAPVSGTTVVLPGAPRSSWASHSHPGPKSRFLSLQMGRGSCQIVATAGVSPLALFIYAGERALFGSGWQRQRQPRAGARDLAREVVMDGDGMKTGIDEVLAGLRYIKEPEYRALEQIVAEAQADGAAIVPVGPGGGMIEVAGRPPESN